MVTPTDLQNGDPRGGESFCYTACLPTTDPDKLREKYRRRYAKNPEYFRERGRASYARNKAARQASERLRRDERQAWFNGLKEGKPCLDCGGIYPTFVMDFHHLDPATKLFNLVARSSRTKESILKEMDKCVLLCSNCHRIRHNSKGLDQEDTGILE